MCLTELMRVNSTKEVTLEPQNFATQSMFTREALNFKRHGEDLIPFPPLGFRGS